MKYIKKQILSWEPLEIKFVPLRRKQDWDSEIFSWLQGWGQDRAAIAGNLETSKISLECYIAKIASDGTVVVHIEWLCEKSIDIFVEYIREKGSNIKQLIIGDEVDETLPNEQTELKIKFVKVPQKIIYTETKTGVVVPFFEISKYPITVGQYRRFAEETNYKTTNEKKGYYLTYFDNDLLVGVSKKKRESMAATCLSYNDAVEYCRWARFRLPSDIEWLSAAILDWKKEYNNSEITEKLIQKYASRPEALKNLSYEWTCEYIARSDSAFVREGPGYLLEKGWKKPKQRKKYPAEYTDLLLQFRVCRETN